MKERVTFTLERDILDKLDRNIDGVNVRNRSHAVELILRKNFSDQGIKKALILCGGKGTRLRPITYEIPKSLIPVQGRPLIEHIFDLLKKYGVRDVILSVGHMKEKIIKHVGDGFKFGVNVTYLEEDGPLGTAGPLRLGKNLLKETFIVSNGDELKDVNIQEMLELHKTKNALCTMALTTSNEPSLYGVAKLSGSRIVEYLEKPRERVSNLINAGFYIMEPEVIEMIPKGFSMLETDVFPKLAETGGFHGFPFSGQWFDTGNIERYEKAIKEWRPISNRA